MAADFASLCNRSVDFHQDLVRNIKSIRLSQALFDDLADTPEEALVAASAEALARVASDVPLITRPFDYGTVISFSFDAHHWQETRFSDATRFGVWYGSLDVKTTVYETVFHWHRFLLDSFAAENRVIIGERRVFSVRCDAQLVDLRGREREAPGLLDRRSYQYTQSLGAYLVAHAQEGLLAKSARCDGTNAAIFQAARLSKPRDRTQLTYRCNPTRDRVTVETTPKKTWLSITPSELA